MITGRNMHKKLPLVRFRIKVLVACPCTDFKVTVHANIPVPKYYYHSAPPFIITINRINGLPHHSPSFGVVTPNGVRIAGVSQSDFQSKLFVVRV